MKTTKIENRLLASHIADNVEFESACLSGDAKKIMMIVHTEMEKNNLHSDGSNKLCNDIFRMTRGQEKISVHTGSNIMMFVWNSRLSGTGFAVC